MPILRFLNYVLVVLLPGLLLLVCGRVFRGRRIGRVCHIIGMILVGIGLARTPSVFFLVFFLVFPMLALKEGFRSDTFRRVCLIIGWLIYASGVTSFFIGFIITEGNMGWVSEDKEFPLAKVNSIDVDPRGNVYTASEIYSRVQVYDKHGTFLRGWFVEESGGGWLKIRLNDQGLVEVACGRSDRWIKTYKPDGTLVSTQKYEFKDSSFPHPFKHHGKDVTDEAGRYRYSVEGTLFPRVVRREVDGTRVDIGRSPLYLLPFQGSFHGWVISILGMSLCYWAAKTGLQRRPNRKKANHTNCLSI